VTKTCYMCTALGTSKEHVPPRSLFPEQKDLSSDRDLRKNLITVRSCDAHNLEKSDEDVFLLLGLTLSISNNDVAMLHIRTKITRALQRDPKLFGRFAEASSPVTAVDGDLAVETLMVKVDNRRFLRSLDHVARGLFRHEFRRRFVGRCSIIPDFVLFAEREMNERNARLLAQVKPAFDLQRSKGSNAEVFNYEFLQPDDQGRLALRMQFYRGSNVYVAFLPGEA
jgi:hypothetical protein